MSASQDKSGFLKKSFWIAFAFYFLIAFEFFYMVSPFAFYFYSVYEPGLSFITNNQTLGWLSSTFLPHFVAHSASGVLRVVSVLGGVMAMTGFTLFLIGAIQVYVAKLKRKQAVTGGIYKYVRHPQYAALAVTGLGLLILWPRYLVLLSFITMLFFYYFLARLEERECQAQFGDTYQQYLKETGMFFPFPGQFMNKLNLLPQKGIRRLVGIGTIYLAVCLVGVLAANQIRNWSLDQIYALYQKDAVTISITRLDRTQISNILQVAEKEPEVQQRLSRSNKDVIKRINYIVPIDYSASEIPMNPVEGSIGQPVQTHGYPADKKNDKYKIVFTQAVQRYKGEVNGKAIMLNTSTLVPLLEVVIDLPNQKIIKIMDPVKDAKLEGIPLPLF